MRKKIGEDLLPECSTTNHEIGGGSVIVWGVNPVTELI